MDFSEDTLADRAASDQELEARFAAACQRTRTAMQWLCLSAGGLVGAFLVLLEVQWLTWLWLWGCLVVNLLAALTRSIAFDRVWQIHQEQARRKRIAS